MKIYILSSDSKLVKHQFYTKCKNTVRGSQLNLHLLETLEIPLTRFSRLMVHVPSAPFQLMDHLPASPLGTNRFNTPAINCSLVLSLLCHRQRRHTQKAWTPMLT